MTTDPKPKVDATEVPTDKIEAFREKLTESVGIIGSNKITQTNVNEESELAIRAAFSEMMKESEELDIAPTIGEGETFAGAVPANAVKVSVTTLVGNITDRSIYMNALGAGVLTSGQVADSWKTGSGFRVLQGDLTIGDKSRMDQIRRGTQLNQSALDDDRSFAFLGRDWGEIQLLTGTIFPGNNWTIVPQRDTNKIFIFRDTVAANFNILQPTLNGVNDHYQFDGFRIMLVNLATADYKLNIVASAGDIAGHSGNVVLSRGACVVLRAVPRGQRAVMGCKYILTPKFGSIA